MSFEDIARVVSFLADILIIISITIGAIGLTSEKGRRFLKKVFDLWLGLDDENEEVDEN